MWQRVEFGVFGLIGYIPVFIGFVLIACINYMGSFIAPGLSEEEMASLQKGSAMMAAMISGLIMLVGEILFGIATFRTGIFPRIATVLFKIGFLAPPVRAAYPIVTFIGLSISGVGIIWWSISLWSWRVVCNRNCQEIFSPEGLLGLKRYILGKGSIS